MLKIYTVCGNGIGSSIMAKMKIDEICEEYAIEAEVQSTDFNSAQGKPCDLVVTIKELADQFEGKRIAIIRSYTNKRKIKEDILEDLLEIAGK